MSRDKNIYKVSVPNFFIHNKKKSKSFTHFMLAKNYFSDHKIAQLTAVQSQFYIYLLAVCCDFAADCVQITSSSLPKSLQIDAKLEQLLTTLESLQLVSYEKIVPLYKISKVKEREVKEREVQRSENTKEKPNKELNAKIWDAYKKAYLERYHVEPVRNAKVNKNISQLAQRLGADAIEVVIFFINHNDPFYLKSLHQIGLCLANAEALHTQYKLGRTLMPKDIKNFEQRSSLAVLQDDLKKGGF